MAEYLPLITGPLGTVVVLALGVWGFRAGWLRTALEVEAWRERALRAEGQVDTILPALERVSGIVNRTSEEQKETARVMAVLLSFMEEMRGDRANHPRKGSGAS